MRRGILLGIGILEAFVACTLILIGSSLPGPERVEQSFSRAGQMTESAEKQVQLMHGQVTEVRQNDFPKIARQLRAQTDAIAANVRNSTIDFATVKAMSDALAAVSKGLEGWSETLDPDKYLPATDGLGATADLLDGKWPAGDANLDDDWRQLLEQLRDTPDGQGRDRPMPALALASNMDRKDILEHAWRGEQFQGARTTLLELESSLASGVEQIDGASAASYPVVSTRGVEMRPVWPDGARTADSMRQALAAIRAINHKLDGIGCLAQTTLVSFDVRRQTLDQHGRPTPGNRWPDSERRRELVRGLRGAQRGLQATLRTWPGLVDTMRRSAVVLQGSRRQLDTVLAQRSQYEQARSSSRQITQSAAELLESSTIQLDIRLGAQQQALAQMADGLHEFNQAIPVVKQTTANLLVALRWLFWLVGGLVGLHGLFLACESRCKR